MNIWGYEMRIKKARKEMDKGETEVGLRRFNILKKRVECWRHCIVKLREKK